MCAQAIAADPLCETAHIHLAHLMLQKPDLARAVSAFDDAVALIRVKQVDAVRLMAAPLA